MGERSRFLRKAGRRGFGRKVERDETRAVVDRRVEELGFDWVGF